MVEHHVIPCSSACETGIYRLRLHRHIRAELHVSARYRGQCGSALETLMSIQHSGPCIEFAYVRQDQTLSVARLPVAGAGRAGILFATQQHGGRQYN